MKKTVLFDKHVALGAKMSPFGGYQMPIQYSSIIKEHNATRNQAAIFDTCHMGEFLIRGNDSIQFLEKVVSCNVEDIKIGRCRYGFICNENGGVIDDQILYRLDTNEFMMVVNASTEENDFNWLQNHLCGDLTLENKSSTTAKLDIQGPKSPRIVQNIIEGSLSELKFYHFTYIKYKNERLLISRTGYTGEIGFEIYSSNETALLLWDDFLKEGVTPAGLGARDTLRLEMGYPLYGHELDEKNNAAQSGFSRAIGTKDFIGSSVLRDPSLKKQSLVGIAIEGRRAARAGDSIVDDQSNSIGTITSGSYSPSLQSAIALGYVPNNFSNSGTEITISTERGSLKGKVTDLPFYRDATCRAKIINFL